MNCRLQREPPLDRFIQENPDLALELELLAQTSLPAEPFSFAGKRPDQTGTHPFLPKRGSNAPDA